MQGLILSLSCPSRGAPPAPGVHRGLPQKKVGSGPHGTGAAEGTVPGTAPSTLPHCSPSPQLSKALAGQGYFVGVLLATLEGNPCNLGSWQPGILGNSTGCGRGLRAWPCPHELCHGIQHQPGALCPSG